MTIREELSEFLGTNYEPRQLVWNPARLRERLERYGTWTEFEKRDKESVYFHVWREGQGWWLPHLSFVQESVPPPATVLEVHANIGFYGFRLGEGYIPTFLDYKTHPNKFLRWRFKSWKEVGTIHDFRASPDRHDAVVAFDCLHRYEDPLQFVAKVAGWGDKILLDLDTRYTSEEVLDRVLSDYQIFNHRSVNHYVHLVALAGATPVPKVKPKGTQPSDEEVK